MDFKLVNQLQKLNEDNNLFKPASEEDLNNRPQTGWDNEKLREVCDDEVQLLATYNIFPDISPDDDHLVRFISENDITMMEYLPLILEDILRDISRDILKAAKKIDQKVKGDRPQ